MFPFLAAAAAVPALYQTITGIKQDRLARKLNPVRPTYTIPGAVNESVDMARQSANAAMPGYGTAQNNIQASTAGAVRAAQLAGSGNNALATIAAAQGNEANAMNNLQAQNTNFLFGQRQNLMHSLLNKAAYQDKAFDFNQRQKYDEDSAAKAALMEGSKHNINNGISGLSSVAITAFDKPQKPLPTIPGFDFLKFLQQQPVGTGSYNDASNYGQQYSSYS